MNASDAAAREIPILPEVPPARGTRRRVGRAHYYPGVSDAEWNDWRWQFKNRVTTLEELERHLALDPGERAMREQVLSDFRMGITPYYLSLIDADDLDDPILRQVVPLAEEYAYRAVGDEDPLGEERFSPVPGITHRYPDRVLMVISNNCAVYCRYCTRKRTMYEGATPDVEIDRMVDYIARTPQVRDVVVSGGDPLNYSTAKLESILAKLRAIPHLEIIRIGSRVPVALPQRIDDELCAMLAKYHPLWVNVHFNHPRELTPEAAAACDRLSRAGIPLNNQAVLLKGVNDSVETIRSLCHGLMRMRVRPYYLYQCDPVRGAEHFRTPISKGIEIMEGLRGHTSGLAVPTYVIDAPGGGGKIPVNPQYLLLYDEKSGRAILRNFQKKIFEYVEPESARTELTPVRSARGKARATANGAPKNGNGKVNGKVNGSSSGRANGRAASNGSVNGSANGSMNGSAVRANGAANGSANGGAEGAAKPGQVVGKSRWVHKGAGPRHGKTK
jgi:lysine 2,3-aminomutase